MRPTEAALGTVATTTSEVASPALPFVFHSRLPLVLAVILAAAGCSQFSPSIPPSEGHIVKQPVKAEADKGIPPPARVSTFVPAPKPAVKPQTYSVVVNEVPVKDLLLALARDTKQNIDVHPGLAGLVSLNAINETLPALLERVSKQVNLRYRLEGNTIVVAPDAPYVKTYRVNYVNMIRDTTSTVGVTGEIGTSSSSAGGGSTSGSSTVVRTTTRNDFWEQLRDNIRAILNSTRLQSLTAEAKAERLALVKQEQELRTKQIEAASRAGQGAPSLATSVIAAGSGGSGQQQTSLLPDDVIVNSISGTVTINATEKQHQLVQNHIDGIVNAMQRQVLIEATIVEVQLSNNYQGGIDWARVSQSGGFSFAQRMLGTNLATAPFLALFYNQNNERPGEVQLTVKLLEQFGNTRVLSSPKMMALNNQTALLKVVDNVVYFEVQTTAAIAGAGGVITPGTTNTTAKTVAVGLVMSVTPQIGDDGRVSITVRPTITRVTGTKRDPNPVLLIPNLVPEIQTREMESVLQVGNGQTVILGGLMQDDARRNRDQIPGADLVGTIGDLFRFRDEQVSKTELVIFLRPSVITNPSLDSDELRFFQRFLPPEAAAQQSERTSAAR
jgi:general secretion pathway protein D